MHRMHCKNTMSISYRRRRGPKAGSTAIPFMITVLISLLVFGGVALYFYQQLTAKSDELPPMQSATTSISDADVNAILFVLDPDDEDRQNAMMMLRFDPVRKQIVCLGIPQDLQVVHEGRAMSVGACYTDHGLDALKNAVAKALDQQIDRYIQMDDAGFEKLVNLIGNVEYIVPIKDTGLRPSETSVMLDCKQFETLLTSNRYSSEEERSTVIGLSVAQLLNQCIDNDKKRGSSNNNNNNDNKSSITLDIDEDKPEATGGAKKIVWKSRISRNLDSYFSSVINSVTTDITAMDFSNHSHAIRYVFEYASAPARGMGVMCTLEDGAVVPNQVFVDNLKILFNQVGGSGSTSDAPAEGEAPEGETPEGEQPEEESSEEAAE